MLRMIGFVVLSAFLAGCTHEHQLVRDKSAAAVLLSSEDSILIAVPKDGAYESKTYAGTGRKVAELIHAAFAKRTQHARMASFPDFDAAMDASKRFDRKYLVFPAILHWENRLTGLNGVPDRVELKIEIIDTATGKTVTSAIVKGKSAAIPLFEKHERGRSRFFSDDGPLALLPEPLEEFVSALY